MKFIIYRPLSGAWAKVMILGPAERVPETVGDGILLTLIRDDITLRHLAEVFAVGLCAGLAYDRNPVEWHWSYQ